jgi:hypothetical protein
MTMAAGILLADGGKVQFRQHAGPFEITLFSSPQPPRAGNVDLSVMLQKGTETILDADVKLRLVKTEKGTITEILARATHALATNKLLYAATVKVPSTGMWRIEVQVNEGGKAADVSGNVEVLPPQPPLLVYWPYFVLVPLIVLLFVVNRWLIRNRRARP